jgi:zinc/manganese transport system substrate-binding protein
MNLLERRYMHFRHAFSAVVITATAGLLATACSASSAGTTSGIVAAVGAENEYANVISQIGGKYVKVSAIESNPNTDPHSFEASPAVAREVAGAKLIVQNGVGYDTYMSRIESSSSSSGRKLIVVQNLLGLPDNTPNPHLWYSPGTMPKLAGAIAADMAKLSPGHAAYFHANVTKFDNSLKPWLTAIAQFKAAYGGTPVAVTEPVGDYMLQAAGANIMTPLQLQLDVMNGVDLSPQYVSLQSGFFTQHKVKVFLYNQQVTSTATKTFLALANRTGTPVVGVYETMPTGYSYQSWMLAEVNALRKAVTSKVSTEKL